MSALLAILDFLLAVSIAGLLLIGIGFLSLPLLFIWQSTQPSPPAPPTPPDEVLPKVLVQLAVFNEPHVVAGLLDSVAKLDWPRDRLEIQLLDDSFDGTADIAAPLVAALQKNGLNIFHMRRDNRAGFKAGALAAGLKQSDAPFVAVLDADFRPPPNWLRSIIPHFLADARAGFVQSRCEFTNWNANMLTRAQGLLFDAHFVIEQNARARAGLLFQFNGTSGAWRRATIDEAGGWSDDTLTEDLDLTVRSEIAGWHGVFVMHPAVGGLVPENINHWRVQQRRWATGFMQNAGKLLAAIARAPWGVGKKLSANFLILYQLAFPLLSLMLISLALDWWLRGQVPPSGLLPLACVIFLIPVIGIAMTLPPFLTLRRGGFARYATTFITLPPLLIFLSLANSLPMIASLFGRRESFKRTPKAGHRI